MSKRRLAIGVVAIAAILLGGRALSILFDSYTWYDSLGARDLWLERITDASLLNAAAFVFAMLFSLANLAAVKSAIGSLSRPRRLANVEFGEAVPASQLRLAGVGVSMAIALGVARLLPSWTSVALARLGVDFKEADPYLQHDLSFYVTWLPLERALYSWTLALVVSVTAVVLAVYVFVSGVRWSGGVLRLTVPVRRHLGILAAVLLLMCTWAYRLDSYELLTAGGHDGSGFSYLDHRWMLPGLLALSLATAATAITVAISAWMGQLRTSLVAIMVAIAMMATVNEIIPFVVLRSTPESGGRSENAPYLATRADFTRRAFGTDVDAGSAEFPYAALSEATDGLPSSRDTLFGPGARGTTLVDEPLTDIAAPSLGSGIQRLAHAWAARNFGLLSDTIKRRARIVRVRDIRDRVSKLYPLFYAGPLLRPLFRADTLYWSVALFTSSASYPLAESREIWGEQRTYFHRAGTVLVNARTGRVFAALDVPAEPVAAGWINAFETPASLRRAQGIQRSLSLSTAGTAASHPLEADTSFRAQVARLYDRMHSALSAGDLRGFGVAYDSLGALVRKVEK